MVACLDEAGAVAFAHGELPPATQADIEAHVDDCATCRKVLAALVRGDREAWKPGARIGRYVLGARIGKGGMGSVFRAEDLELGRGVALKKLHAGAGDDERARLLREARAAAQLQHPNTVAVYEVGESGGESYLAMELVDGETLTAWLASTKRSRADILRILVQAGRGLAAAHARGLVHRDFKPDNVLVDKTGRARVADFGLARHGEPASGGPPVAMQLSRMTQTNTLSGTPAYMAPELVEGDAPNARTDQYAFAVTAFEAIHGQHPFRGDTVEALWLEMSSGRIAAGSKSVPAWLDKHVRRGLAVDPKARWQSVAAMVDALESPPRGKTFLAVGAALVVIAGGAVAYAATREPARSPCEGAGTDIAAVWPGRRADLGKLANAPEIAAALDGFASQWQDGARASCRATESQTQTPELAEKRAICLDRARIKLSAAIEAIAQSPVGARATVDELPDLAPCDDLDALKRGVDVPVLKGEREELRAAEIELARAETLRDRDPAAAATALATAQKAGSHMANADLQARAFLLAYELDLDRGDAQAAENDAIQAWTYASHAGDRNLSLHGQLLMIRETVQRDPKSLELLGDMSKREVISREEALLSQAYGHAQMAAGHYKESRVAFERAAKYLHDTLPDGNVERSVAEYWVAAAMVMHEEYAQAIPRLEAVHTALEKAASPYRREAIDALHALGLAYAHVGRADDATAATREVVARRAKLFGEHAGITAISRMEYATALSRGNHHAEAMAQLEQMIADVPESVNRAEARVNLAGQYIDAERFREAEEQLALARPVLAKANGEDHVNTVIADVQLASARVARVQHGEKLPLGDADKTLARARAVFATTFGDRSQPVAAVDLTLGESAELQGKTVEALVHYDRSVAALDHGDSADRAEALADRGKLRWKTGARDAGKADIAEAERIYAADGHHADQLEKLRAWVVATVK